MSSTDGNQRHYKRAAVRQHYASGNSGLWPIEEACLAAAGLKSGSILDLGIGAGRTTGSLLGRFGRYVGVDYSAPLIEAARERYPEADLHVMDARQLPFENEFDCVLFSYNGLDYVNPADRAKIVGRIVRALRPGGAFIYSSHNLRYRRVDPWMTRPMVRELYRPIAALKASPARLRNFFRQQTFADEGCALVNDPGLGFRLLTLYVDPDREAERLVQAGLAVHAMFGATSTTVSDWENEPWAHYVAVKPRT